jgi:hypothetical protein
VCDFGNVGQVGNLVVNLEASACWQSVFHALYSLAFEAYLNHRVDQGSSSEKQEGPLKEGTLQAWDHIWNKNDEAGVKLHLPEEPNEVDAIIGDEREFIFQDSLGQFPVRLTTQAEMIDVGCFETGAMSDSN